LERKLRELGLPFAVAMEIVKDVMGSPGQSQHGLVDTVSEDQLDSMLSRFESRWNNLEEPYNSPPCFHVYIPETLSGYCGTVHDSKSTRESWIRVPTFTLLYQQG